MAKCEKDEEHRKAEVPDAGRIETAEDCGQPTELRGPIDCHAGKNASESGDGHLRVSKLLKRVVLFLRRMIFPETKIIFDHRQHAGDVTFPEQRSSAAMLRQDIIEKINDAVAEE